MKRLTVPLVQDNVMSRQRWLPWGWIAGILIGVGTAFTAGDRQTYCPSNRLATHKALSLNAKEVKQLVRAVLETDMYGNCSSGKCSQHRMPLLYHWHPEVPPVLVVQLTGVRAPLPLEMEWESPFKDTKDKRVLKIRVLIVKNLVFTKKQQSMDSMPAADRKVREGPHRDGNNGPLFYLVHSEQGDPALQIEAVGRKVRGLAAWLMIGEVSSESFCQVGCSPPDPQALPAIFTLYDGTSWITPQERYRLELKRDQKGNWLVRARGKDVYL